MKKIMLVLLSLVILSIAGYYWLYLDPLDVETYEQQEVTAPVAKFGDKHELAVQSTQLEQDDAVQIEALATMGEEEKQIELLKVKEELDVLMARYDRNLSDESKRTAIKKEMQALMERYDKLVLQQAMSDIKKSKG